MSEVPAFSNANKYSTVGNLKIDHLVVFKSIAFSPLIIIPFLSKHLVNEMFTTFGHSKEDYFY